MHFSGWAGVAVGPFGHISLPTLAAQEEFLPSIRINGVAPGVCTIFSSALPAPILLRPVVAAAACEHFLVSVFVGSLPFLVMKANIYGFDLFLFGCRTKWKRQTSVGLELFVEANNFAAYQNACMPGFNGQMDRLPYPGNPLMLSGAHRMLPSSVPVNPALLASELYYQQVLQSRMNEYSLFSKSSFQQASQLPHPLPTRNAFPHLETSKAQPLTPAPTRPRAPRDDASEGFKPIAPIAASPARCADPASDEESDIEV